MLNSTRRRRRRPRTQSTTTPSKNTNNENGVVSATIDHPNQERRTNNPMTLKSKMEQEREPSMSWVMVCAALYVLSGVTQPILMSYAQHAGLANPRCQLYMLFYYIGPASVAFTMRCRRRRISHEKKDHLNEDANGGTNNHDTKCTNHDEQQFLSSGNSNNDGNSNNIQSCSNEQCTGNGTSYGATAFHNHGNNNNEVIDDGYEYEKEDEERSWPSQSLLVKTSSIALFDIFAQSMTYTGNNFAGPTIFSIIYSSVTIWTALYSKFLLSRSLSKPQWMGVCIVVAGLSLTAMDSLAVGESVFFWRVFDFGGQFLSWVDICFE
mmetsp:Transcript_25473/g.54809  ORF Transcript_25473/g.54809 Transcript_25473/m.54809 type:complete len:322 (+) Transcript_25473:173-1138(+)